MSLNFSRRTFLTSSFSALTTSMLGGNNPAFAQARDLRVPAEWEYQAATWLQWPSNYEAALRPAFARIILAIQLYQPVHLLVSTQAERNYARTYLFDRGVLNRNLTFHLIPTNNAWMRDNGPIYVKKDGQTLIQNWEFTGWDGTTGTEYDVDNLVPLHVARKLGLEAETLRHYVLEKGNLEVNGRGTGILNWDCQHQRNPHLSQKDHEKILKDKLGLQQIIWAYGHHPEDLTTGHIDGTARFIGEKDVVLAEPGDDTTHRLAADLRAQDFNIHWYDGDVNWLVGNGFVLALEGDDQEHDYYLRDKLRRFFPDRDIHLVDAHSITENGGGIHCVTNDQPVL